MRQTGSRVPLLLSYLCDSKVQADVDDDSEEEDVEGSYDQERLLQHQDLIEVIMNLVITKEVYQLRSQQNFTAQIHTTVK